MIVDVALPIPVAKIFSYTVPDRWKPFAKRFLRLKVPFHNKVHTGIITDVRDEDNPGLKEIHEIIDLFPIINDTLIELGTWASHYYVTPIGPVLKYLIPPTLNIEPYITIQAKNKEISPGDDLTLKKVIHLYGRESVFQHYESGLITLCDTLTKNTFSPIIESNVKKEPFENILFIGGIQARLDYYIENIASELQQGSNVLMLLPDHYAAGSYFRKILSGKFGHRVLWYGSGTTAKSRMETFFRVRAEGGYLVLGNKSCVFLPMRRQSLIIVERQEEDEYRNEEGFKFNAGMVAMQRAFIGGIPIIQGSASPSLEMYHYAEKNRFNIIEKKWLLEGDSQENFLIPDIASSARFLEEVIATVKEGAQKGDTIAIFTPRKDYGSRLVCHQCKKPFLCPECEGTLGYEKKAGLLICSLCGKTSPYEEQCRHCGSNIIRFSRIGAEYVEEKLKNSFPDLGIMKITGDSLKEAMKKLKKMPARSPLVLVGTQSLSKLYDLHVECLVLFGWEELRKMGGYRSDEKMVQILINLIDALTPEKILFFMERKNRIDPAHYLDLKTFYREELRKRQEAGFPPYKRIFLIEIQKGKDMERSTKQYSKAHRGNNKGKPKKTTWHKTIKKIQDILQAEGFGATGPDIFLEKNTTYKWKLILSSEENHLQKTLFEIYNLPEVRIETDPLYI